MHKDARSPPVSTQPVSQTTGAEADGKDWGLRTPNLILSIMGGKGEVNEIEYNRYTMIYPPENSHVT